jgi:toxin ParE1/3/4
VKPVQFSPLAENDLIEIGINIARDNPKRAHSFLDELEGKCEALGAFPSAGVERPELAEGLRSLPHGRYLIFYRNLDDEVRIERILHRARDIAAIFDR